MDPNRYLELNEVFSNFAVEFFELMDEVDSHKEVTILRLKEYIDDRTRNIIHEQKRNPPEKPQHNILTHTVEIKQIVENANKTTSVKDLPKQVFTPLKPKNTKYSPGRVLTKNLKVKPYITLRQPNKQVPPAQKNLKFIPREKSNKFRLLTKLPDDKRIRQLKAGIVKMKKPIASQVKKTNTTRFLSPATK